MDLREIAGQELRRHQVVEFRALGEDRTLEFPFSSELPVDRWFGSEILSHQPDAPDLSRLNDGAPVLWNHDPSAVIGVVERAWIDGEKQRGMARVRFSRNELAQQIVADITDGILRNVSFGYGIKEAKPGSEGEIIATRWEPHEVSVVSIPADRTVGIGRSLDAGAAAAPAAAPIKPSPIPMEDNTPSIDLDAVRAAAASEERQRVAGITAMTREHGCEDLAQGLIERGATEAEATKAVLAEVGKRAKQPATPKASTSQQAQPIGGSADIGLSEKEVKSYSFLRAIRAQMLPNDRKAWDDAAFEREVSEAVSSATGKQARGFLVPHDVMRRDLTVATASGAGDLVFTDARPGSFIEVLRNRLALASLGVQMLTGLQGPVAIPRQTGQASASWVGEGSDVSETAPTVDQINLTPKTLGAFTEFSRRLILQSSIDVEQMIRNELATVIALEIDRAALYGLGNTSQPLGLKNVTGINTEDFGAAAPTYPEIVSMESKVAADNADIGAMAYITTSTIYGGFKTTEKFSTTGQTILEPGGTVNGYPVVRSNQVVAGDVFFGVWSQMIMGMWGALDLQVNPYALDKSGGVRVTALQDVDVVVRHPEAFCRGANTL
jgi:HK97 family phage major capsid protein/HK97 family phage prohead protease